MLHGCDNRWYVHSTLFTGAVLNAHRDSEVVCGVQLHFTDYRLVTYIFIATFFISFLAAIKINFAVSVFLVTRCITRLRLKTVPQFISRVFPSFYFCILSVPFLPFSLPLPLLSLRCEMPLTPS